MTPEFLSLAYFFPDTRVLLKSLLLSPFRLSNRHLKLQTFITTLLLFLPSRSHLNSFSCHEMSTLSKKNSEDLFISQAWSMCLNLRHHQSSALGQWEPVQVFIKRCFNSQTNIDLCVFCFLWSICGLVARSRAVGKSPRLHGGSLCPWLATQPHTGPPDT